MDMIIFSKDRAFQLYTALETINKYVSGINTIYVQIAYSEQKYLDGYLKLNELFGNVIFVDETEHGFYTTLTALLKEIKTKTIAMDVDDVIYYDKINLEDCANVLMNHSDVLKFTYNFNPKWYNIGLTGNKEDYTIIDRNKSFGSDVVNFSIKYPFNVSWSIYTTESLIELLQRHNFKNPIDLESKSCNDFAFNQCKYNLYGVKEVAQQIHLNNFLNRYDTTYTTDTLNDYFLNNEVINIDKINFNDFDPDMRWINNKDIGRFPIFPWEIAPKYHKQIIENRRKI